MKNALRPQPTYAVIKNKIRDVIDGKVSRESVCDWAMDYIRNDDDVEVTDLKAWEFLVAVSNVDAMTAPGKYLYSNEDFEDWIKEYS